MRLEYQISEEGPDQERVSEEILTELLRYNAGQAGPLKHKKLVLASRAPDKSLLGGLVGIQYWNGMFIDLVWVHEQARGRGIGTELMKRAEDALRSRGGESGLPEPLVFPGTRLLREARILAVRDA